MLRYKVSERRKTCLCCSAQLSDNARLPFCPRCQSGLRYHADKPVGSFGEYVDHLDILRKRAEYVPQRRKELDVLRKLRVPVRKKQNDVHTRRHVA